MASQQADKRNDGMAAGVSPEAGAVFALPPLLAPAAGAFTAATILGMGLANQMAGAYLGFWKGAFEATKVAADALGIVEDAVVPAPAEDARPARADATVVSLKARAETKAKTGAATATVPAPAKARTKKASKPAASALATKPAERESTPSLRSLPGMGPKLESLLKARGLGTLDAIAALSGAEAEALDRELGLDGRIARDGWLEKAATLARG